MIITAHSRDTNRLDKQLNGEISMTFVKSQQAWAQLVMPWTQKLTTGFLCVGQERNETLER
jgi:hypothetical protein